MPDLQHRFRQHIDQSFPFLKGKKILSAISGGLDSVVLTHLLIHADFDIVLAHCNFRLRGNESDQDEIFVKDLAMQWKEPLFTKKFDTKAYAEEHKISVQMAARDLRYNWFEKIRKENSLGFIATAHHADDTIETFLINLVRGTGLNGLIGIPEFNKNIIRPLLPFSREEIRAYAVENQLQWREDSSNLEEKYLRNKIRHQIIPVFKEMNLGFQESFRQTINHLKGSSAIVEHTLKKVKCAVFKKRDKDTFELNIEKIKKLPNTQDYLYEMLKDFGFTEWDDVVHLLDAQPGKQVLSKTHRLIKDRKFLLLTTLKAEPNDDHEIYRIGQDQKKLETDAFTLYFEEIGINDIDRNDILRNEDDQVVYLDKEKITYPITVRKWQKGDYFYPLGMRGKKKLSKYFKDKKISVLDKEKIWLLCTDNQIAWIIGKSLDDRFKTTDKTLTILKIST